MISEKHKAILEILIKWEEEYKKGLTGLTLKDKVSRYLDLKPETGESHVRDLMDAGYIEFDGIHFTASEKGKNWLKTLKI